MSACVGVLKNSSVPFDYYKNHQKYLKAIAKYETIRLWRRDVFQKIAQSIISNPQSYWKKYEVIFRNEEPVLILHRNKSPKIIECLSAEESFDVFLDVHLATGHGGRDEMLQNLRQRYHVSTVCLKIFLQICNVCKFQQRTIKPAGENLSHTALVSIIDLTSKGSDFGYILVYRFKWSGFTLLRPITVQNYEEDVALELLNIFLDFGPPVKIVSEITISDLILKVMAYISNITSDCTILVENKLAGYMTPVIRLCIYIRTAVTNWMERTNSRQWALACYYIQYMINKTPTDTDDGISPHFLQFKKQPQINDVSETPVKEYPPLTVLIKEEEDDDCFEVNLSPIEIKDEPGPSKAS